MSQSRVMSGLEAATNVAVGWLVALATQLLVFPTLGLQVTIAQNLTLSFVFTAVSLVRSYAIRRAFEWSMHRDA